MRWLAAWVELPQSALHPAGPAAETIAFTGWLMTAAAALAWLLVVGLFLWTCRRRVVRGKPPGEGLILVGGVVFPTVLLVSLLAYGSATSSQVTGSGSAADEVVEVLARQWRWEFTYLDGEGLPLARSVDRLLLPRGRMVEFRIRSADVIHSFWIPRLGGKIDAIPGQVNRLRLRADRIAPLRGQCAEFCGRDHSNMAFEVQVLEPEDYRRRLAQAGDAAGLGKP